MKTVKNIAFVFIAFLVFALGIGAFLPNEYAMERSIVIKSSAEEIFPHINNLRKWESWSPWKAMDPNMEITYSSENPVGEDAWYSWKSENKQVGIGKLTITESTPNKLIRTQIKFGENLDIQNNSKWTLETVENGTKVTWELSGTANNFGEKYFGILLDQMMGDTFENGLNNLKTTVEK